MGSATYTPETPTLLRTKLHRPRLAADLISRSHLLERLNRGFQRRATLISAPAGFGKTTLLGQWLDQAPYQAAWLSLDEGDNHLAVFLSYFAAAIQTLFPRACSTTHSLLAAPQTPAPDYLTTALINEIADLPETFLLVLDDYHLIDHPDVHQLVSALMQHGPSQLHLVIATRQDPRFSIARLRATQGQTGQTLTYDGGASSGQNPIVSYAWDFGDGASAEGVRVDHIYNEPGSYNVALTVTDDQGLQGSSSLPIQIYPVVEVPDLSDLEGKTWSLVEAATFDVEPITALFEGGIVSGFSGCNTYNANYQSDGSNLTISNLTTTQAVCDEAATTRENKYLANLSSVNGYVVQGDQLTLTGAQPLTFNKLVATPAATP